MNAPSVLVNLRDVGHLAGAPLYRSAQPYGLAAEALAGLAAELGLRTVIDLRSPAEQTAVPWPPLPDGVRVHSIPIGATATTLETIAEITGPADMARMYARMARGSAAELVTIVRLLSEGPALVHCAAGKDRTGVVIAVVLSLLGIDPQRISEEYALTEAAMPTIRAWALDRRSPSDGPSDGAAFPEAPKALTDTADLSGFPDVLMRAPAETMLAFLAEVGDVHDLLTAHGLTDDDLAALRATFAPAA
ncbi:tyrosine-protein phosphatase [Actinomadura sp. WMMB 499]|uniref:tyrosine-protein phosphatase n=1 Tax=Actinomadura sp. WMMB 499 TaxID=1219491 RepID=UPI00159D539F|nr:tyrosine-protein phosphatase [Actinomadura sp. WMMB 499]